MSFNSSFLKFIIHELLTGFLELVDDKRHVKIITCHTNLVNIIKYKKSSKPQPQGQGLTSESD